MTIAIIRSGTPFDCVFDSEKDFEYILSFAKAKAKDILETETNSNIAKGVIEDIEKIEAYIKGKV